MGFKVWDMYKECFFDGVKGVFFAIWFTIFGIAIIISIYFLITKILEYFGEWFIIPLSFLILMIILEIVLRISE